MESKDVYQQDGDTADDGFTDIKNLLNINNQPPVKTTVFGTSDFRKKNTYQDMLSKVLA
jgi:hypothetical protein